MSRAQTPPELLASLGGFGDLATPAGDKEFAFAEPWQAETLATTVELSRRGVFTWKQWVERFSTEIRDNPQREGEDANTAYYRQWLAALEQLLASLGIADSRQIDAAQEDWRRSYLHTEHGKPVQFRRGLAPVDADIDHHHHHHDHGAIHPNPVAICSPKSRQTAHSGRPAMTQKALHYLEIVEVAERLRDRTLSSVELTTAMLERIAGLDSKLNSYIRVTGELALSLAETADREIAAGDYRGPLHGVPIALKDIFDLAGFPTTAGMPLRHEGEATEDASVVRRLKQAGAVILGKNNLTEGVYAEHRDRYGPPVNPWDATRWPGASSSGSGVATAAGLCFASIGSDTGGSIRLPSAANGVTGLKPTWGRVSRHGVFELAATLDHIGPIARSAVDAGLLLGVLAGADPLIRRLRNGRCPTLLKPPAEAPEAFASVLTPDG